MNQKITLRFADHVLTFKVPKEEVAEVEQDMRRKWIHRFIRADGIFLVNLDQVLWMRISPGDDIETKREEAEEEAHILFKPFTASF